MIRTRKARQTGTLVSTGRALDDLGIDTDPENPWACLCEKHSCFVTLPTRKYAEWHASDPAGWCELCREELDARKAVAL